MKKRIGIIALLCLGFAVSGCAVGRGVVDIRIAGATNPETTVMVKIVEVKDARVFEIAPKSPSTPSLENNEINNLKITSIAIARKRNGYGMALGDIVLPLGRTVAKVTEEALTNALKQAGYRVVSEGEPGYETARPLSAEVKQFWAWFTPGFSHISVEHEARVLLKGQWPVKDGKREIYSRVRHSSMMATTGAWRKIFLKGVYKLVDNVRGALKKAPG